MLIDVHLGKNADFTLTFKFYDNLVATRFYERMQQQDNQVINRHQFYNLGESEQDVKEHLDSLIIRIKELAPNLLASDSAEDLNELHINFPEHQKSASGELFEVLRDFNYTIHHLENKRAKSNAPSFLFACEDPGEELIPSAYELFTVSKKFGELYMPYPHVGKHLFELFLDNDINVPSEQIVCTHKMCNGCYVWLGNNKYVERGKSSLMRQIYNFYIQVQHKMVYEWGDPRLTIGYLPLAMIISDLSQEEIVRNVASNQFLHSWTLR